MMGEKKHKSGFVNIIGYPNAGKSTLVNQLMGMKLNIVSPKAQTTRHRILAIDNGEDYQIVYSDTPGLLKPAYELHKAMQFYIEQALEDADIFILLIDLTKDVDWEPVVLEKIKNTGVSVILTFNKYDLVKEEDVEKSIKKWTGIFPDASYVVVSALNGYMTDVLKTIILQKLPEGPEYFPKNENDISDKNLRYFVSEIIREKIFLLCREELPYSVEVYVEQYKENPEMDHIYAVIVVERESQKPMIIGKQGRMLKEIGTLARKDIEELIGKKVFLSLHVKVDKNWRKDKNKLKKYGYLIQDERNSGHSRKA